jgi:hypothetical protein
MSVQFACGQCGKQLAAKPELAGKRVKCPQCGQAVQVPGGAPAAAPAGQAPGGMPAGIPGAMAPGQMMPSQMMPGAMTPGQMAPGPMMSAPPMSGSLADLLDDSGPGKLVEAPQLQYGQTLCPGCQQPIQIGAALCVKCGLDLRAGKSLGTRKEKPRTPGQQKFIDALIATGWMVLTMVIVSTLAGGLGGIWIGFNLVERELPFKQLAVLLLVMGGGLAVLNYFSIVADAFQEGWGPGLMIFVVPGYWLYFIATRWKKCRKPFIHYTVATAVFTVGLMIFLDVWRFEAAHPQPGNVGALPQTGTSRTAG